MTRDRKEIFEKIVEIISDITEVQPDLITEESYCFEEIGIESFDITDINFSIEDEFGIEIEEDSFWNIRGMSQDSDFFDDDDMLTKKGIKELKSRIPELDILDNTEKKLSVDDIFNLLQVKHLVDFVIQSLSKKD